MANVRFTSQTERYSDDYSLYFYFNWFIASLILSNYVLNYIYILFIDNHNNDFPYYYNAEIRKLFNNLF